MAMKFCGPFKCKMEVMVTDGENVGMASMDVGWGTVPDAERAKALLAQCEAQVAEKMPGFRLATRHEFVGYMMDEVLGTSEVVVAGIRREGDWDTYEEAQKEHSLD